MTSRLVGVLRGYRVALRARAAYAVADGRHDYALACWHVLQDVAAFLEYLTRKERREP